MQIAYDITTAIWSIWNNPIFQQIRPWIILQSWWFCLEKMTVGLKLAFDRKGHAWMGKQFCELTDKEEALFIYELL